MKPHERPEVVELRPPDDWRREWMHKQGFHKNFDKDCPLCHDQLFDEM